MQEARTASALNHPNIVTIYEISAANGVDFLTMEFVPGRTLGQIIGRKGLACTEALKYAVQIADALAAAHAAGIVHRDLKPKCLLVSGPDPPYTFKYGVGPLVPRDRSSIQHQ